MDVVLGVAIGVVLTIGVVAIVVSSVMELISAVFKLRAKALKHGIARLLDNDREGPVASAVMAHPLIRALYTPTVGADRPPAYIDAVTFATAFLGSSLGSVSLIAKVLPETKTLPDKIRSLSDGEPGDTVKVAWSKAGNDPAKLITALFADVEQGRPGLAALVGTPNEVVARIQSLSRDGDAAAATLTSTWQDAGSEVRTFLAKLEQPDLISRAAAGAAEVTKGIAEIKEANPFLGKSLEDLWARAGFEFGRFSVEIEDWFDRKMARVSGWYSRESQYKMVAIALAITAALNISLITVARTLWTDPDVRSSTVILAERQVTASAAPGTTVPTATSTAATTASEAEPSGAATTVPETTTTATPPIGVDTLSKVGLPIGWNENAWPGWNDGYLILHLFGWLLTAITASFGAPFWFDLLNKLVNLRAGGRPPLTAADQREKESGSL